jgi:prepilin-type N-terminal cleavage/methylation domain-containing protein
MRPPLPRGRRAFTLLELVVVVVVLAILAAIAIPSYILITARSQRAAAESSLIAFGRQLQAMNAFDSTGMISEQSVLASGFDMSKLYAAGAGVLADGGVSLQRDVAASYDRQVVSYALGEATVGSTPGTVYPGNAADRRLSAPWVGLAVFTSKGDCVGIRFSRAGSEKVKMTGDAIDCTGGTALIGVAVAGTPSTGMPGTTNPGAQAAPALTAAATSGRVLLSWPAVIGATSYTIYRGNTQVWAGAELTFTDEQLTNGVGYTYTATATSSTGTSAKSAPVTITPAGAPAVPAGLSTEAGNKAVRVSWTETASNPAGPVAGYRVYADGVQVWTGTGGSALIGGLDNGTVYAFTVTAYGSGGESGQSAPVQETPVDVAGTPALTGAAGDSTVVVSWTATDRAKSYEVFRDGVSVWKGTALTFTDANLTNGVTYSYTAVASGNGGASLESSPLTITPAGAPATPAGLTVTSGAAMLKATWTRVGATPAGPVTGYRVYVDGVYQFSTPNDQADVDGLTNGTAYTITVSAYGNGGESAQSAGKTGTPVAVPAAPSGFTGAATAGTVALSWGAVATSNASPVTGYEVLQDGVTLGTQTGTTKTITGLTNGVEYEFTVRTKGASADSVKTSAVKVTPVAAPSAPATPTVTAGDGSLSVSWTAVTATAAAPVTGYRIFIDGVQRGTTTDSSTTITGLTNGTAYSVTVAAYGNGGVSDQSTAKSGTPITAPAAPTGLTATAASGQVTLSWNQVTGTTAAPVSGYEVFQGSTKVWTGTAASTTITGLTNGTSYSFTVRATGPVAQSAHSGVVTATPAGAPGAPTALTLTPAAGSIGASWTAPASNGGSAITGYTVTVSPSSGTTVTVSGTTATVTGVTAGTAYTVSVTANNAAGASTAVTATATALSSAIATPTGQLWGAQIGGALADNAHSMAADEAGNVYVTGNTLNNLYGPLGGTSDVWVVSYSPTGQVRWSRHLNQYTGTDSAGGVFYRNGAVYVAGISGQNGRGFVNKLDASTGSIQWSGMNTNFGMQMIHAVTADASGNVYISGLGNFSPSYYAAVASFDSLGNTRWARFYSSYGSGAQAYGLAVNGSTVLVGVGANGSGAGFTRINAATGDEIGLVTVPGSQAYGYSVTASDESGVFYVAGVVGGQMTGATSAGSNDVFVARITSTGAVSWVKQFGSSGSENTAGRIAPVYIGGKLYVSGWTNGAFPGKTNNGGTDVFVFAVTVSAAAPTGLDWVHQYGSTAGDVGMFAAGGGKAYLLISVNNAAPSGFTSRGSEDGFLFRIS